MKTTSMILMATLAWTGCAADESELDYLPDSAGEVDIDNLPPAVATEVVAEVEMSNGNLVTFFSFPDGSVAVQEMGHPSTNALGTLPELHGASPLEVFQSIVPSVVDAPEILIRDQEQVDRRRAASGISSSVPAGFHVDELPGFLDTSRDKAFNTCTNSTDWINHVGSSPIGSNCPGSSGKDWYACWANVNIAQDSECVGSSCTRYFTAGYNQMRASTSARSGSGYVRFVMGLKNDNAGSWSSWFDHTLYAGYYYYYWYSSGTEKDFWQILYRTGNKKVNWSLWVDDL